MAIGSNFNIQLSAIVDTSKLITNIQSTLDKHEFKINVNAGTSSTGIGSSVKGISRKGTSEYDKAASSIDSFSAKLMSLKDTGKITSEQFEKFGRTLVGIARTLQEGNFQKFSNDMDALKQSVESATTSISVSEQKLSRISMQTENFATKLINLKNAGKITNEDFDRFNKTLNNIDKSFNKNKNLNKFSKSMNTLKNEVSKTVVANKQVTQSMKAMVQPADKLISQINELGNKNKLSAKQVSSFTKQVTDLKEEFRTGQISAGQFAKGIQNIGSSVTKASGGMGEFVRNLGSMIRGFVGFQLAATIIMQIINMFRQLVNEVVNVDNAMVELNKVTDLTSQQLNNVKKQAFDLAGQLGRTGEDVINATTEFARMGYTINESLDLAKVAVMMTNVAEGITDTGEAANILTSILKGTNTDIKYANSLLDRLNEISNNNAVSFDALAHMTQESAATMKILGNNLDETMGLLTGAYSVLQDESVANGIQTIGLRIAGLNEDLEAEAGLSNQVVEALQKYAGINAFDEQTGQLKNTYAILEELAGVWDTIDKNQQSALLNTLAGKRQADVAAAILNNWEGVEKAVSDAQNSMGSALKEQEAYLDSIQGHLARFKNVLQELADLIIGSEIVKSIIDIGTGLAKIIGYIVSLVSAIAKLGGITYGLQMIGNILNVIGDVLGFIVDAVNELVEIVQPVWDTLSYYLGFGWLVDLLEKNKEAEESNEDLADSFEDEKQAVSEYDKELKKLIKDTQRYISLISKNDETESLAERLEFIEEENNDLKNQRELQEKILAVEKARLALAEAKNKKVRVFRAGQGFVYESDQSEVQSAQEGLMDAINELSEFRYELLLERAQEFVDRFNELVTGDESEFLKGWEDLFDDFGDLLDTEFSKYIRRAQEFVDAFKKVETSLDKTVPETTKKEEKTEEPKKKWNFVLPSIGINPTGRFANGTDYSPKGVALVGEEGPELVELPLGSRVHTASETSRMLGNLSSSGGLGGTSFNVGTVVINEPNNFEGFVNEFCSQLNVPKPVKFSS